MNLYFTKMESLGNDFIVVDGINQSFNITPQLVTQLADRHFGIGCDQVLLIESSTNGKAHFKYRIFNADGSEVSQCGNGARCVGQFLRDQTLTDKDRIQLETKNTQLTLSLQDNGLVKVEMGVPIFEPTLIPFTAATRQDTYSLQVGNTTIEIIVLALGNPHAVQIVPDVDNVAVDLLGPLIEQHIRFPERVNAGFMQRVSSEHIKLRVYERGVGETLACGSGACAAVVAGINLHQLEPSVRVSLPGGDVDVSWAGADKSVVLSGSAHTIFNGNININ